MQIPHTALSADTLQRLLEEFVTRDGTDYGEREHALEDKVEVVRGHLRAGRAVIEYDEESESCSIVAVPGRM